MTIIEEGRALRSEISKLRPDKRRRYGRKLIQRILGWVERAVASGMTETWCGELLGITTWRFRLWRKQRREPDVAPLPDEVAPEPLALVPITVTSPFVGPTLVTPSGYRVEGLGVTDLAALLRELV